MSAAITVVKLKLFSAYHYLMYTVTLYNFSCNGNGRKKWPRTFQQWRPASPSLWGQWQNPRKVGALLIFSIFLLQLHYKSGLRIRIRINMSCWIRIHIQIADPEYGSAIRKNAGSGSALNQCASATLLQVSRMYVVQYWPGSHLDGGRWGPGGAERYSWRSRTLSRLCRRTDSVSGDKRTKQLGRILRKRLL